MAEGSSLGGYDIYRLLVVPKVVIVHVYCAFSFVSYQNWMLLGVYTDINEMGS